MDISNIFYELSSNKNTIYFAYLLSEVNKKFTKEIKTACISKDIRNGNITFNFNKDFWDSLNTKQKTYVVIHECYHYICQHWYYIHDFKWDNQVAQWAFDCYINSQIDIFITQERLTFIESPEGLMKPSTLPEFNMKEGQDSHYYYKILKQKKEDKESKGTSGSKLYDSYLDSEENENKFWKDLLEGLTDAEKEIFRKEVEATVQRVAKEAESSHGNVPLNLLDAINKTMVYKKPVLSWTSLFKRFVSSCISTSIEGDRKKLNKRFRDFPGFKYKHKVSVAMYSDSSSSVDCDSLERCWDELHNLHKAGGNIHYASWDQEPEIPQLYKGTKFMARTKCGGTSLINAIQGINDTCKQNKYNLAVITTDGYIDSANIKCKVPLIILITKNGTDKFDNPYNYKVVFIND